MTHKLEKQIAVMEKALKWYEQYEPIPNNSVAHKALVEVRRIRDEEWRCVWCRLNTNEARGKPCIAPDGDGHLFKGPNDK